MLEAYRQGQLFARRITLLGVSQGLLHEADLGCQRQLVLGDQRLVKGFMLFAVVGFLADEGANLGLQIRIFHLLLEIPDSMNEERSPSGKVVDNAFMKWVVHGLP